MDHADEPTAPLVRPSRARHAEAGSSERARGQLDAPEGRAAHAVETQLIDIAKPAIAVDDAGEKARDGQFAETMNRSDALVIVAPEYNHGYPGPDRRDHRLRLPAGERQPSC